MVAKVKILNLNLMSKDLEVKFGKIIEDYGAIPFPKFKENKFVL